MKTNKLTESFNFQHQTNNYINIIKSLEQFNIIPNKVYYEVCSICKKPKFVVSWSNPNILWQKFHNHNRGYDGSNNFIFYKNHKIKTTVWCKMKTLKNYYLNKFFIYFIFFYIFFYTITYKKIF